MDVRRFPTSQSEKVHACTLASHWLARRTNDRAASAGWTSTAKLAKASRKIPALLHAAAGALIGESPFLWFRLLLGSARNELGFRPKAFDFACPVSIRLKH